MWHELDNVSMEGNFRVVYSPFACHSSISLSRYADFYITTSLRLFSDTSVYHVSRLPSRKSQDRLVAYS
jgi:hypothetical protein